MKSEKRTISSTPIVLQNKKTGSPRNTDILTCVLPLTVDDLSRSTVLFESLEKLQSVVIKELLIFVPAHQLQLFTRLISVNTLPYKYHFFLRSNTFKSLCGRLTFPCTVYNEEELFEDGYKIKAHTYTYGIQMAIKLLAAKLITTDFYLTLDADVILLRPFNISHIVYHDSNRAIYRYESRSVHEHWWRGSEKLLQIRNLPSQNFIGFGVTPAVLSTFGSLLVLGRMQQLYCPINSMNNEVLISGGDSESSIVHNDVNNTMMWKDYSCSAYLNRWLDEFGHNDNVWSEYTLYRLTLEYYGVQIWIL